MATEVGNGSGNGSNRAKVSVRSLINSHSLTKAERAFIAKRVKLGEVELELTDRLIAMACGVSVTYMHAAEKCDDHNEFMVHAGMRPLIFRPIKTTVNGKPALVIPAETDDQLVEIAHRVGVERMWDAIQRAMT
jgi:hypothetical protein